jgi:hypothetical protein
MAGVITTTITVGIATITGINRPNGSEMAGIPPSSMDFPWGLGRRGGNSRLLKKS